MSRNVIIAVVAVGCCALALLGLLSTPWLRAQPRRGTCEAYLAAPSTGWLSLRGCALDMEQVVLESETGQFEPLAGRRDGVWRTLPSGDVRWVVAWAPVKEASSAPGVVRAVYRLDGSDLMQWLNVFDRASPAQKERLWADPVPLRRLLSPARVEGFAEKPPGEGLRNAFGTLASANLVLVTPGQLPVPPVGSLVAGVVGLLLLALVLFKVTRGPPGGDSLRDVGANLVEVELGALEQLRKDERAAERGRPPTEP